MKEIVYLQTQSNELITGLVGIAGAVIGAFASFLFQMYFAKRQENQRIRNEFELVKNKVLSLLVRNDYYLYMKELRDFFIKYYQFVFQPNIKTFWDNWLNNDPHLQNPEPLLNPVTEEELTAMQIELIKLELDFSYLKESKIKKLIKKAKKESPILQMIENGNNQGNV